MLPEADEGAVDALEAMLTDLEPISTLVEEETAAAGDGNEEIILRSMMKRIFALYVLPSAV